MKTKRQTAILSGLPKKSIKQAALHPAIKDQWIALTEEFHGNLLSS